MNSRPGDVFHPDFQQGRPAYFDITIRNSLQSSYISMSVREAGAAALAGESEKDHSSGENKLHVLSISCRNSWGMVSQQSQDLENHCKKDNTEKQSARPSAICTNNFLFGYGSITQEWF